MPIAYSYLRFSSPQQAAGDSVRRQVEKTAQWCQRNKVELDSSMKLRDEGVSAFKGKNRENPDTHALAAFLDAVRTGRVPRGSYLVVESLDRLSREKIRPALTLLLNLIECGIKVVQLLPAEVVYDEDVEPMQLLMAVMELNRGHSESKVKSERVGAAWAKKQREAGERIVTKRLPGWVHLRNGKLELDPAKVAVVRRIFQLAISGHGVNAIARELNADDIPTMGRKVFLNRKVRWNETVVYHVLKSRATYGLYQPHKGRNGTREPVGRPVENYYPAAVTQDIYLQARAAMKGRKRRGAGRRGKHVNMFAGLLMDAVSKSSLTYKHVSGRGSSLVPVGAKQGHGTPWSSFAAVPFETAVLAGLREVPASEVRADSTAASRVEALRAEKGRLDALVEAWKAQMDNLEKVAAVAERLAQYGDELANIDAALAEAQREAAQAGGDPWGEFVSLAVVLDRDNSDEMRSRVKAAIRRCVTRIWCAFGKADRRRIALARVELVVGKAREFIIIYEQGRANGYAKKPGKLWWDSAVMNLNQIPRLNEKTLWRCYKEAFLDKGRDAE